MRKRLRWRLVVIFAVTVICLLGITGFPPSLGKMEQRIRLGLDLKGGTHVILQVVTDDAVNIETDPIPGHDGGRPAGEGGVLIFLRQAQRGLS